MQFKLQTIKVAMTVVATHQQEMHEVKAYVSPGCPFAAQVGSICYTIIHIATGLVIEGGFTKKQAFKYLELFSQIPSYQHWQDFNGDWSTRPLEIRQQMQSEVRNLFGETLKG